MFPIVRTGAFNDKDFMIRLLIGCLQHKAAPDLGFYFSAVPADHVAGAIVAISSQREALDQTFHLANSKPRTWREIMQMAQSSGFEVPVFRQYSRCRENHTHTCALGRRRQDVATFRRC